MSLRLRAVCRRPAICSPQPTRQSGARGRRTDLRRCRRRAPCARRRPRCRRAPSASTRGVVARDDVLLGEHHQMRVVDGHERRQQQGLGVLEVVVEHVGDVLGGKPHFSQYTAPRPGVSMRPPGLTEGAMRRFGSLVALLVVACGVAAQSTHTVQAQGQRDTLAVGGLKQAGGSDPRPLGPQSHLRAERRRPVHGAGLPGRQGSPLPVRGLAPPRHRHRGRDSRAARTQSRHRHAAPQVSRRPRRRAESLPPARQADRRGLRARRERLRRRGDARAGGPADRVQDARHHARQVDAGGGDLAPPGADLERARRGHPRAGDRRPRQQREAARAAVAAGRAERRALAHARSAHRSEDLPRRRAQALQRLPRPDCVQARGRGPRLPRPAARQALAAEAVGEGGPRGREQPRRSIATSAPTTGS